MARRRGLQEADAEDVMQQVFLSIARSIEGWTAGDDRPPFRAWLTTITRNAISRALARRPRDAATGSTSVMELLYAQPDPADTAAEIVTEGRREIVFWAAEHIRSEFSQETWRVFWQTAIEGLPIAQVAAATGRSVGSIYVARYRVMTRLREKVLDVSLQWGFQEARL